MRDKFFITGANGQLGRDLIHELTSRNCYCIASDIGDKYSGSEPCEYVKLDITNYEKVSGTNGYWLESPHADYTIYVCYVYGGSRYVNFNSAYSTSYYGSRPVIEVLKSDISFE